MLAKLLPIFIICVGTAFCQYELTNPLEDKPNFHDPPSARWGEMVECPKQPGTYSYVYGFRIKVLEDMGKYDDTAMNGVQLKCKYGFTPLFKGVLGISDLVLSPKEAPWGDWLGWRECSDSEDRDGSNFLSNFLRGFNFNAQPIPAIDNRGGVTLNMECEDGKRLVGDPDADKSNSIWSGYTRCRKRYVICGVNTKIQPWRGLGIPPKKDDGGLTNLKFLCCYLRPSIVFINKKAWRHVHW